MMSFVLPFDGMRLISRQGWRAYNEASGAVVGPEFAAAHPDLVGWRWHNGTDWTNAAGETDGTQLHAGAPAEVLFADNRGGVRPFGGYGNAIVLRYAPGVLSLFAHCRQVFAVVGTRVDAGDVVATVGDTSRPGGRTGGPHLHWELTTSWPLLPEDTRARYDVLQSLEAAGWFLDSHARLVRGSVRGRTPGEPTTRKPGAGWVDLAIVYAIARGFSSSPS